MKLTFAIFLWLFSISIVVNGQEYISTQKEKNSDKTDLSFTTEINEQKYCSSSKMFMRFRVSFKNVGIIPIILDRDSKAIFKWKFKQISGKMRKNFEATIAPYVELGGYVKEGQFPTEESFIVLQPNETYSYITKGGILVDMDDGKNDVDGLREGKYTLQFTAMTWYYSIPAINEYTQKWKEKGFLWSKDIVSEPMPFEVQKTHLISKCEY